MYICQAIINQELFSCTAQTNESCPRKTDLISLKPDQYSAVKQTALTSSIIWVRSNQTIAI